MLTTPPTVTPSAGALLAASNLTDLASASAARTALNVYGKDDADPKDTTRAPAPYLLFDGATSGARASTALGTPGDGLGTGTTPWTFRKLIKIPTAAATKGIEIWSSTSAGSGYSGYCLQFLLHSTDLIRINLANNTGTNRRYLSTTGTGIVAQYAGKWVAICVTYLGDGVAPLVYINGVVRATTETTGGSAPAWNAGFNDDYAVSGTVDGGSLWQGPMVPSAPILGAWSDAEVLEWAQTGLPPTWCAGKTGSMVPQTSGTLTIGRKYRITASGGTFTGVGAANNSVGTEFVATGTAPTWSTGAVISLGLVATHVIQPTAIMADVGSNKLPLVLTSGVTTVTDRREFVIQATTEASGNQQLNGSSCFFDYTKFVIDDWWVQTSGTPTVYAGNVSGGNQYVSSVALSATKTKLTLVTQLPGTNNLWWNQNSTATVYHTIRGHMVD